MKPTRSKTGEIGARQPAALRQRFQVLVARERPLRLGLHQLVLPEVRHLLLLVALIEGAWQPALTTRSKQRSW
jgi:hypothetical protein